MTSDQKSIELGTSSLEDYGSDLIEELRRSNEPLREGDTVIHLAQRFGFCYGVQRAIQLIYAARERFPESRIFLLGEIIHNPEVNARIEALGIIRLRGLGMLGETLTSPVLPKLSKNPTISPTELCKLIAPEDVVVIPAFGVPQQVMDVLVAIGCHVVNTTCGHVMRVWRRVRQNTAEGITSIIHGKSSHEETLATASQAHGGHYLVISGVSDCEEVCQFIRSGGDAEKFLERFHGTHSEGFDPIQHLQRIGVANQTTMLRNETLEIQSRLRDAIIERDGDDKNFHALDTVCNATQERQDALLTLLNRPLDFLLVVGGYNSSNTTHLVQIGQKRYPTYFIQDADCMVSAKEIRCYDLATRTETSVFDWMPLGEIGKTCTVGITAGASCPDNVVEAVVRKVFALRN